MAALAFCSLDFCSFGGMVSSSYARSTARADCLWTASLTPGPPFPFGGGGRATRATFPSTNPFLGRIFPRDEGRNRVQTPLLHRNRARATSQNPAAAKGPPREGRGRVEIPCCERKKKISTPPPPGGLEPRAGYRRASARKADISEAGAEPTRTERQHGTQERLELSPQEVRPGLPPLVSARDGRTTRRKETRLNLSRETTSDLLIEGAGRAPDHAQDVMADQ